MLLSTALKRIKDAGHDISDEYTNERYVEFLNTALQQTSALLIAAKYPALVKEMLVRNGDSLPTNYIQCCGTYPLRMTDGVAQIIDDDLESVKFRYWATPAMLTEDDEELPYKHDAINEVIVRAAVVLALNENEYDVSADNAIVSALQQAVASAIA